MNLVERSYGGDLFRPRPEIYIDNNGQIIVIATPWGPRSSAKKAIQVITDHFLASQQDREATTPFHKLSCLSPIANDIRVAVKMANDVIYYEDNKNEYISGVELFVLAQQKNEVAWIQVGMPAVFLDRPQRSLAPLGSHCDLASEFSMGPQLMTPLPSHLLGIENSSDFAVHSFRPAPHDRFVILSRSGSPSSIYQLSAGDRQIDNLSRLLAQDDKDLPFWLGILDFNRQA